ncbi:MAG: hypothetical protein JNM68_11840 [Dinghuibacter sp.]|nr:hypothetical protein [Dinghuibacter sp.]
MKKVEDFDFEELLANSANELRMRPSQQVWKAINRRLHQRRKVYAAAVLLLLLGLFTALNNLPDKTNNNTSIAGAEQPAATTQPLTNNQAVATRPQNATVRNRMVTREEPVIRQLGSSGSNSTLAASVNNIPGPTTNSRAGIPAPVSRQENIAQTTTPVNYTTPSETENETAVTTNTLAVAATPVATQTPQTTSTETLQGNEPGETGTGSQTNEVETSYTGPDGSNSSFTGLQKNNNTSLPVSSKLTEKITASVSSVKNNSLAEKMLIPKILSGNNKSEQPQLNETGSNSEAINITAKPRRFTTEYYITPSISYRKMTDSRDKDNPGAFTQSELDNALYHKPSIGFEAGVSWHYRLYDRLRAKMGLQLNYNRFNMKAAKVQQAEIATVNLYGNNRDRSNPSNLRTNADRDVVPEWLENKNIQVSVPVGIEAVLANSSKGTSLNMGITVQPSYLLRDKNYIVSTDLKNYLLSSSLRNNPSEPSLTRRFNVNLGLEAFFAFSRGNLRWHVGPQFRYQLFSTYNKIYPIRENLIDYGFKIGISKPF